MDVKSVVPMWLRYRLMELRGRGEYSHFADEHQCIFIHIPKAAGTSVALTLFEKGSRHVPWFEYHQANPRKFRKYFKFAFVRNPWDRLVSSYCFLREGGLSDADATWAAENLIAYSDFGQFVRGWVTEANVWTWRHFIPQHHFICDNRGKVMVDFVGRFESIENDFSYIAAHMDCPRQLAKANVGDRRHYTSYYDDETRDIVRRVYAKDIELFAYSFQSDTSGSADDGRR